MIFWNHGKKHFLYCLEKKKGFQPEKEFGLGKVTAFSSSSPKETMDLKTHLGMVVRHFFRIPENTLFICTYISKITHFLFHK